MVQYTVTAISDELSRGSAGHAGERQPTSCAASEAAVVRGGNAPTE